MVPRSDEKKAAGKKNSVIYLTIPVPKKSFSNCQMHTAVMNPLSAGDIEENLTSLMFGRDVASLEPVVPLSSCPATPWTSVGDVDI